MPSAEEFKLESDNYEQTVLALCALKQHTEHEYDADLWVGRKMNTSSSNRVQSNERVTPDAVIQLSQDYGIIAELKKSIPRDNIGREKILKQLLKYDDNLIGWKTEDEEISGNDIICLTHTTNSRPIEDYIKSAVEEDIELDDLDSESVEFDRNTIICEFVRNDEEQTYITFKKERGIDDIRHSELEDRLDEGLAVSSKHYNRIFYNLRFSDDEPPLPYLLSTLWDLIFPTMVGEKEYSRTASREQKFIEVTVDGVVERVQKNFGVYANEDGRTVGIPQKSWIRRALDALVGLGHAEKVEDKPGEDGGYIVQYRTLDGDDNLEYFAEELANRDDTQGTLSDLIY